MIVKPQSFPYILCNFTFPWAWKQKGRNSPSIPAQSAGNATEGVNMAMVWKWQYRSLAGGRALIAVVPAVWTEVHWSRRATLAGGAETINWDPYLKGRSCLAVGQGKCPEIISYLDWHCRNTGISWVTGMPSKIKSPIQVPAWRLDLSTWYQGTIALSWLGWLKWY